MSNEIGIPNWVPRPVVAASNLLAVEFSMRGNGDDDARQVLDRVTHDERMQVVWRELYKKSRVNHKSSEKYFHPACVTNKTDAAGKRARAAKLRKQEGPKELEEADLLELEAAYLETLSDKPLEWSEQDEGVYHFFIKVVRNWQSSTPMMAPRLKERATELEQVASRLRREADLLHTFSSFAKAIKRLKAVADECEEESWSLFPWRPRGLNMSPVAKFIIDDPGVFIREKNDMKLKAFMADVAADIAMIFQTPLHGIVATITNVAFDRTDVKVSSVREVYRTKRL